MTQRKLIVSHHAPDLDAIASTWILTRFDPQHYENASFAFVNPGKRIKLEQAEEHDFQLHQVTHVDTGLGKFDHHQPERARQFVCAASLTYEHVLQIHPELEKDQALEEIVNFVNEIDHFKEIQWPQVDNPRYVMMLHELIRGHELKNPQHDEAQMEFGLDCLDYAYQAMQETIQAKQVIMEKGQKFEIKEGTCLAIKTANDETIKYGQKQGYIIVVRKDPKQGHVRIKARPDSQLDLKPVYEEIKNQDNKGTWFYHPGGKMLLNGSVSDHSQAPTPLSLKKVVNIIEECYA